MSTLPPPPAAPVPPMRNPYLIGEQVYLRPVEEADAATCYPWMNDPDVRRNLNLRARPNTEAASRAFFRAIDFRNDQVFAIVTRAGGEYVGNCGLHEIDFIDRHATLGIVIGRKDHWDRGLGTETVRLVCRHAFETLNLHKVCLHCYASNERGLKVYERVGFKVEGRLREHQFIDGRYDDEIVMGLLRAELRLA